MARAGARQAGPDEASEPAPTGLKPLRPVGGRTEPSVTGPSPKAPREHRRPEEPGAATNSEVDLVVAAFAAVRLADGREFPIGRLADDMAIPAGLRRRLRGPNRTAVRAGLGPLGGTDKPVELVFCSRHGDLPRTQNLLLATARRSPLSPLEFPLSVHNAIAGMLDLARGERTGHTSIAAGRDSFDAALIELWARLRARPDRAMLLLYVEHEMPEELRNQVDRGRGGIILAALIETPGTAGQPLATLRRIPSAPGTARDSEADAHRMLSVLEGGGAMRLASRAGFDWLLEPAR